MPEISRFFGIIIFMYFDEHNPPHFHVKYGEERAVEHRQELMNNWISLETTGDYSRIAPLE